MDPEQDASEGMSTTKKVVAGAAAVGVAVPAAVAVGKKLMGSGSDDEKGDEGQADQQEGKQSGRRGQQGGRKSGQSGSGRAKSSSSRSRSRSSSGSSKSGSTRSRSSSSGAKSGSRSRSGSSSGSSSRSGSSSGGSGRQRTKEQLYATAKRLKIDGRSKMTKAQLERAVARAR
jgi:DNA end-binding protein Ku